jgi:RNA polymerase sigma-70 factor (ECF subfamily)
MAAVARRALGDAAAEDVVQDVFTRLWQAPHRFDSVRGPLRSFLILQVRSRTIDVQRTDSARRAREDRDGANDQRTRAPASAALDELYSHETLGTLLHGLVRDEREPIRLAFFEGYTYREVAALLDVPEGTVKSRIRAGLQRLRSALDVDDAAAAAPQT